MCLRPRLGHGTCLDFLCCRLRRRRRNVSAMIFVPARGVHLASAAERQPGNARDRRRRERERGARARESASKVGNGQPSFLPRKGERKEGRNDGSGAAAAAAARPGHSVHAPTESTRGGPPTPPATAAAAAVVRRREGERASSSSSGANEPSRRLRETRLLFPVCARQTDTKSCHRATTQPTCHFATFRTAAERSENSWNAGRDKNKKSRASQQAEGEDDDCCLLGGSLS